MGNSLDFTYPSATPAGTNPVSTDSSSTATQVNSTVLPTTNDQLGSMAQTASVAQVSTTTPSSSQSPVVDLSMQTSNIPNSDVPNTNVPNTQTNINPTVDITATQPIVPTIQSDLSYVSKPLNQDNAVNNDKTISDIMNLASKKIEQTKLNVGLPTMSESGENEIESPSQTPDFTTAISDNVQKDIKKENVGLVGQDNIVSQTSVISTENLPDVSRSVQQVSTGESNVSQPSQPVSTSESNVSQTVSPSLSRNIGIAQDTQTGIQDKTDISAQSQLSDPASSTVTVNASTQSSNVINADSVSIGNSNISSQVSQNITVSDDGNSTQLSDDNDKKEKKKKQSKFAQRLAKLRDQFFTVEGTADEEKAEELPQSDDKNNADKAEVAEKKNDTKIQLPELDIVEEDNTSDGKIDINTQAEKEDHSDTKTSIEEQSDNATTSDLPLSSIPGMPVIEKKETIASTESQQPVTKPVEEYNEFAQSIQNNKLDKLGEKIMDNNMSTSLTSTGAVSTPVIAPTVTPVADFVDPTKVVSATSQDNAVQGASAVSQSDPVNTVTASVSGDTAVAPPSISPTVEASPTVDPNVQVTNLPFENLTAGTPVENTNTVVASDINSVGDVSANKVDSTVAEINNQAVSAQADSTNQPIQSTQVVENSSPVQQNTDNGLGAGSNGMVNTNITQENKPIKSSKHYIYSIEQLLAMVIERNASDLHVNVGYPAMIRLDGSLVPVSDEIITEENIAELVLPVLSEDKRDRLEVNREIDLAYAYKDMGRFRINAYFQQQTMAAAFRLIPSKIRTIDELGLPPIFHQLTKLSQGLVLVTGPTGHGKSTTLASIIQEVNLTRQCHILTIEDPIEYVFPPAKALISQREVQDDTHSWQIALKSALREDPNVILVGEMRDYETISSAITLAETGHLVFATLHTNSASQTVDRIIDVFPENQQSQIRAQLANVVEAIIGQRLIPLDKGGRKAVCEIMIANPAVRNLIREGKTHQLDNVIGTSSDIGMISLESALVSLVRENLITMEKAMAYAVHPEEISRLLKG